MDVSPDELEGDDEQTGQLVSVAGVARKVKPSVVGISTLLTIRDTHYWDDTQVVEGIGSGVIVDKTGYILTNEHVVAGDPDEITVVLDNGRELQGRTLWMDAVLDMAIVKVNADDLPQANLGSAKRLEVGDAAIAIGTPLGLQFQHTVTLGIVSALNRTVRIPTERGQNFMEDLIQTDASINPGNSGGPLVNIFGEVVGINTVKITSAEGIGFAIPIDVAKPIIERFVTEGEFTTPYLGIVGFDKEIASHIKKQDGIADGIYVVNIDERGPAYKAGIRRDDIVTGAGGRRVDTMLDLRMAIYSSKVNQTIDINILRDGKSMDFEVMLVKKPYPS
jgi:S1-C subfamily serine protease